MWRLSGVADSVVDGETKTCQVIRVALDGDTTIVDLVALDTGTPFTIHIGQSRSPTAPTDDDALLDWAGSADIVHLVAGCTDGRDWLCLSDGRQHFVVELSAA